MKPLVTISARNSIFAIVAAMFVAVIAPATGFASPVKGATHEQVAEGQVSVQYCGADQDSYLFRVEFENPKAEKFSLIVKNDDGITVYQEQYETVHFAKIVRLPREETDIHPSFIIHTANSDIKRSFAVSRRISENLVVTKL